MIINSQFSPYAQVLVDLDAKALDRRTFTYAIPEGMETAIQMGVPVSVPFGRMRLVTGYVVGLTHYVEPGIRVKEIVDILDDEPLFDVAYLQFLDWVAQYTATPLMTVLSAALPSSMVQKTRREAVLLHEAQDAKTIEALPLPARMIIATLKERPAGSGVQIRYLATRTGLPLKRVNQLLYQLQQQGLVRLQSHIRGAMAQKRTKWLRLNPDIDKTSLTQRQQAVLDDLADLGDEAILLSQAVRAAKTTPAMLEKLSHHGVLRIFDTPQHRDQQLLGAFATGQLSDNTLTLNAEQAVAVEAILQAEAGFEHLLYGITGSGKTEVYLALTDAMLQAGKSVLVLVPEISLTSHLAKRFIQRFGMAQIALWHSHLSAGEKADAWRRIHRSDLKIIIGARSAIFTPLPNLGLIVMDEAHDGSYKQDSPAPRYHAGILASELARRTGAKLVLGSATPDVETFWRAKETQRILRLTQRYGGRSLAKVDIVDMRSTSGARGIFSKQLLDALQGTIFRGEQAIILLNRRGFYTVMTCQTCGEMMMCPQCAVALTYHRVDQKARCHYCGFETQKPQFCPHCASFEIDFAGTGTQRLEYELAEALPEARLLRLDSDIMQKKLAYQEVFEAFSAHQADILIGTQMVAKGLDIPNVTLVGVIQAETAFFLPDYKASERGFQLLTQVAGRSGRGDKPGRVMIQTIQPHHPVILRAKDQDYEGFYEDELARRQEFDFPPYSQLFRLVSSCTDAFRGAHFLRAVALNLRQVLDQTAFSDRVVLLGPSPCVIGKIQGRYRYQVMIKNQAGTEAHQCITRFYTQVSPPEGINLILDVDAQSFL